jgi:hypothetical protein
MIIAGTLLFFPKANFGQIVLGPAASKFAVFTTTGAVGDNASAIIAKTKRPHFQIQTSEFCDKYTI